MIERLSSVHSKTISFCLFMLFYTELFCVNHAYASMGRNNIPIYYRNIAASKNLTNKKSAAVFTRAIEPAVALVKETAMAPVSEKIKAPKKIKSFSGGPGQPEMQSFQSVNTNNMVDLFSGDFSYNIPLLDVGGYPVNLHYRSGISMDQEASWVGLGWNINPGTITRNMRGIPDDFNGKDQIVKTMTIKKNWTAGVGAGFAFELFGYDATQAVGLGFNAGLFYNNYKGIGLSGGFNNSITGGMGSKGSMTAGFSVTNNSQSGISISPSFEITANSKNDSKSSTGFSVSPTFSTRTGLQSLSIGVQGKRKSDNDEKNTRTGVSPFSPITFAHQAYTPTIQIPFTNLYTSLSVKFGAELFGLSGTANLSGYYSQQYVAKNDRTRSSSAYGYLYLQNNKDKPDALLDFNREKELTYRESPATPHLAVPVYTHDIYSITGEGTGGMFRPYRSDIGFVHDQTVKSKGGSASVGLELGSGELLHAGGNIEPSISVTESNIWSSNNELKRVIPYTESKGLQEAVYFRNPSEKTISSQEFYDKIGDTDPMLPMLTSADDAQLTRKMQPYKKFQADGPAKTISPGLSNASRDKRTQVISYLTAGDAINYGLDKVNSYYPINSVYANKCVATPLTNEPRDLGFKQSHHLSEINVLNNDGKRYVYGLPVYNKTQVDVTMSVDKSKANLPTGQVTYDAMSDPTELNIEGTDNYYSREVIPGYAHSFMLTGILSADYVDRLEDGITDDDQGDAVKFNYSRAFGNDQTNFFKWRAPYGLRTANYNEGLKTDKRDDRGTYMYGEKEIVYLNSIESKTMIAVFKLNDPVASPRKDGCPVLNEDGELDTEPTHRLRYLSQIDLYAKADLLKNGADAKPIKTVHLEYGYQLCRNNITSQENNNDINQTGKLTLQKVWFSYNKNEKGQLNPYKFFYHPTNITDKQHLDPTPIESFNPNYQPKKYDRWGNFKDITDNPASLDNADYPYAIQDASKADHNASVWTLTDIQLPSSGRLHINYESDDYAFVQNKRAAQMTKIVGFAHNVGDEIKQDLYSNFNQDYHVMYVRGSQPATTKEDINRLYLEGIGKLFIRMRVEMPSDIYGSGNEQITTYARVADYGPSGGNDPNLFWIKLQQTGDLRPQPNLNLEKESPLAKTAIQALRLNLPSKAYVGSDLGSTVDPAAVIKAMIGFVVNFGELFTKFGDRARLGGWAKHVDINNCFVRLNNPEYKKYGGGHRVKSVILYDHWFDMTGQKESTYGQEYEYTTTRKINGVDKVISSGVAAYEPAIGNDENPFHQPIEYDEQIATLAPVNNMYSEEPLGEAYFPGASVGYSKVRVHSIHGGNIKSATGFEETEFYTSYDFPTLVDKTPLEERKYKPSFLAQAVKINVKRYLTQAQGFSVETNDMDGKMKATSSYPENDPTNALSYTKYFYQADDDKPEQKHLSNTVSVVNGPSGTINPAAQVGKSVEMLVDFREQKSVTQGLVAQLNGDGFILGIIPVTVVVPYAYPQYEESRYRSAATLKLVQRYGILNKVEHYEKGSKVTTENLLYDSETGETVLSKVENEFKDPVYTFGYPAYWAYSGMGPAYQNIGATFSGITLTDGQITNNGGDNDIEKKFESGDEIMLSAAQQKRNDNTPDCDGEIPSCAGFTTLNAAAIKAWAIKPDKIQDRHGLEGLRFIDKYGKFISTSGGATMTILRSGKRNLLTASTGNITSLANPVVTGNDGSKSIQFGESTKVLNATASSFKDFWKVEDAKYKPVGFVTSPVTVHRVKIYPTNSFAIAHECDCDRDTYNNGALGLNHYSALLQTPYFEMAQKYKSNSSSAVRTELHSWMQFDLRAAGIPANAVINNASLKLYQHFDAHTERPNVSPGEKNHPATDPHVNAGGYDNEAYLYFDNNPDIQNINPVAPKVAVPTGLSDNNINTYNLFKANRNISDNNCSGCAVVRATNNQSSYIINLKSQIAAELPLYSNNGNPKGSWLRMVNTDINDADNSRLCFWSVNSQTSGTCASYEDGQSGSSNSSLRVNNNEESQVQTSCTYCSVVTAGSGSTTCNTAPELTIDYVELCPNGLPPVENCGKFYCTQAIDPTCLSYILDTAVNPYRFGILGNWRMDRAYTYFDKRKETNPLAGTDIRNNGVVNSFLEYWTMNINGLIPTTNDTKWVWNSQMTLFNRKGFETENKDPLGRYNAVQYGYNQTLPVAVSQNARFTEQAFEGFEDADYDNTGCAKPCAVPRHLDIIDNLATKRTMEQAHTGKYSLKLNAGEIINSNIPVIDSTVLEMTDTLFYKIDTVRKIVRNVYPRGPGLLADYYYTDTHCPRSFGGYSAVDYKNDVKPTGTPYKTLTDNVINIPFLNSNPPFFPIKNPNTVTSPCSNSGVSDYYFIRWRGYVQPTKTGFHSISAISDNAFRLYITVDGDEKLVVNNWPNDPVYGAGAGGTVYLKKGTLYQVRAEFNQGTGPHKLTLSWSKPENGGVENFSNIFYPANYTASDTAGSVQTQDLGTCINPQGVRAKKQIVYRGFSPQPNHKYLLGAWVKEQAVNTTGDDYAKVQVQLAYLNSTGQQVGTTIVCKPKGTIIEGWQRIEEFVTIPATATNVKLSLVSLVASGASNGSVYLDDLRLHPFNANMKSYVYNPVDIKLMAELDENNYASFYEYDDEGTLIRVKKETERGIKTIKETRSALVKDAQ